MSTTSDTASHKVHARILLPLLAFFSLTGTASANAGTPLMMGGVFHLLIGNLVIGILEGMLLAGVFKCRMRTTVLVMILANYASTWAAVGLAGVPWINNHPLDLGNLRMVFLLMVVAAWAFTILVEWPFVRFCFRGMENPGRSSIRASLVVQTLSYILLMTWYWTISGTSLLTSTKVVGAAEFKLPEAVEIFYIDPADGDVYRRPLSRGATEKVFDLNSNTRWDMLFVTPPINGRVDLHAVIAGEQRSDAVLAGLAASESTSQERHIEEGTWFNFGPAMKIGNPGDHWQFETGFWEGEGLEARNLVSGETVLLTMETPFCSWHARNAVHLPGDLVLFQLGENQICVFDPATRRIALLCRGRGFVAVIPRKE